MHKPQTHRRDEVHLCAADQRFDPYRPRQEQRRQTQRAEDQHVGDGQFLGQVHQARYITHAEAQQHVNIGHMYEGISLLASGLKPSCHPPARQQQYAEEAAQLNHVCTEAAL